MTRENRNLIINTLSAVLFAFVFLFAYSAVMNAQTRSERIAMFKTYFPSADNLEVLKVNQTGLDQKIAIKRGNMTIGYFYEGSGTTTSIPGHQGSKDKLVIHVYVRSDRQVMNVSVSYSEHTADYVDGFLKPDLALIKNVMIENYLSIDLVGGASAFSMPIVHNILAAISRDLTGANPNPADPADPIKEVFGEYGSASVDATFTPNDKVIKKEIVKDASDAIIGYAYTLSSIKNTGNAVEGSEQQNWGLTLMVGVDLEGEIVGIYTIDTDHTNSSSYYGKSQNYYNNLKGVAVSNYQSVSIDVLSGASFSRSHILELLTALQEVLA